MVMITATAQKAPKKAHQNKVLVEKTICAQLKVVVCANDNDDTEVTIWLGENSAKGEIDVTRYFVPNEDYTQVQDEYLSGIIAGLVDDCYSEFGEDEDEDGRYCTSESEKEDDEVVVEVKVLVNPKKKRIYFYVGERKQLLNVTEYLHEDAMGNVLYEIEQDNLLK